MRKSPVALLLAALALAALAVGAVACGSGDAAEPSAGQSGDAPASETTEATTTTTELSTTTLPESVVVIPDVSDLGLEWDEPMIVDEVTGEVPLAGFNQYLFDTAPSAMLPEGTLDELPVDDLQAAVDEAIAEAPFKTVAVYLGLEPDEPDTQMLRETSGGPEGFKVIVILSDLEDDSVRAVRWEFAIQVIPREELVPATSTTSAVEGATTAPPEETTTTAATAVPPDLVPVVYTAVQTTQCQPGRGHQDFATGLCV